MHLAIGKILNKEQKAKDQIRDLENQLQQDGQDIKQKLVKTKHLQLWKFTKTTIHFR